MAFNIKSDYTLDGDQPQAVDKLVEGIVAGNRFQTLLGATGTGKTFTMANVIQRVDAPIQSPQISHEVCLRIG